MYSRGDGHFKTMMTLWKDLKKKYAVLEHWHTFQATEDDQPLSTTMVKTGLCEAARQFDASTATLKIVKALVRVK